MAEHWFEIGIVDYVVKILANLSIFVPAYGLLLKYLTSKFTNI